MNKFEKFLNLGNKEFDKRMLNSVSDTELRLRVVDPVIRL